MLRWRREGRLDRALSVSEAAVAAHPGSRLLLVTRARVLMLAGRAEEAETCYRRALELSPLDPQVMVKLASACLAQGRYGEVLKIITTARRAGLDLRRTNPSASALLFETGDYHSAAREAAREINQRGDADRLARHELALTLLSEDADAGLSPRHKRMLVTANERLRGGEPAQAEPIYAKILARAPGCAPAWIGLKGALQAQGRLAEAAAVRQRWIAAAPFSRSLAEGAAGRRLSRRGLVFDPRERVRVRRMRDVLARLASPGDLARTDNGVFQIDPGGAPVKLEPVISLDPDGADRIELAYPSAECFIASLKGAALVGAGVVLTDQGEAVDELLAHPRAAKFKADRNEEGIQFDQDAFRDGMCEVRCFDEPAFLMAGPTDRSFGDWIINFPPRLALAEAVRLDCQVVVNRELYPRLLDMLVALGVDRRRIMFHDRRGVSVFPRLYAPSWPMPRRGRAMQGLFDVYRRLALPRTEAPRELIYLSREEIRGRRLVNEAQVRELFQKRGFRVVHTQQLSFEQTRELFAAPACVAAPYGSALLNLVLCAQRPVGLVLLPPAPAGTGYLQETASWLANLDIPFAYVMGRMVEGGAGDEAPWTVSLERVEHAIERVLEEAGRR